MTAPPNLFDVNARIGYSSRGREEVPNAAALLARMDALGVQRALVWHVAALENNPTWGNRQILEALEEVPGDRLLPAFVISPTMLWEQGGVRELKEQMRRHHVRALRIFPTRLNHTLNQIEPLLAELTELNPVLLLDSRTLGNIDAVSELAAKFPRLRLIYTHASWPQFTAVYDLLLRHENIFIDTSWLHGCGTLEGMVREFGAHRLIFGIGHSTSNGASIIDLSQARLDPGDREQIGHLNLEHLLGVSPGETPAPPHQRGSLWNELRHSRPVPLEIIDAHGHLGPINTWMLGEQQIEAQIADILPRMDAVGIRTMIVSGTHALFGDPVGGNLLLEEHASRYPEGFLGYLVFNPHYHTELLPLLDDFFSRDFFVGFKLLNSYWEVAVTDPRCEPVWEYANRHHLPILLHTWDDPYDHPRLLEEIAPRYPNAVFILGHTGGVNNGRQAAVELALKNRNVYLEWCGSYQMTLPYEEVIRQVGAERILFGTDATLHSPAWELGRYLSLPLSEELLIPGLGENMRRILARRRRSVPA